MNHSPANAEGMSIEISNDTEETDNINPFGQNFLNRMGELWSELDYASNEELFSLGMAFCGQLAVKQDALLALVEFNESFNLTEKVNLMLQFAILRIEDGY